MQQFCHEREVKQVFESVRVLLEMRERVSGPRDLAALIRSAPRSQAEGLDPDIDGPCIRLLVSIEPSRLTEDQYRRYEDSVRFLCEELPLEAKTRSMVECVLAAAGVG